MTTFLWGNWFVMVGPILEPKYMSTLYIDAFSISKMPNRLLYQTWSGAKYLLVLGSLEKRICCCSYGMYKVFGTVLFIMEDD